MFLWRFNTSETRHTCSRSLGKVSSRGSRCVGSWPSPTCRNIWAGSEPTSGRTGQASGGRQRRRCLGHSHKNNHVYALKWDSNNVKEEEHVHSEKCADEWWTFHSQTSSLTPEEFFYAKYSEDYEITICLMATHRMFDCVSAALTWQRAHIDFWMLCECEQMLIFTLWPQDTFINVHSIQSAAFTALW